jgi:type II secretion system protein N
MKEATRKYGGYVLFALAVLFLFAWLRMPSEAIRSLVLSALSRNQAEVQIRFDSAQLAFPFGVTLTGFSVQTHDGRGLRINAETVTAHPALSSLVTGHLALRIEASAMGGRIDGEFAFRNRFSASGPVQAHLRFGSINAADCPWLAEILGRQVRGRVDGQIRFSGLPERWTAGSGHLELVLVNGLVAFQAPLFGLDEMSFTRIEGNMDLENGTLKVNRFQLAGENIQGAFQGNVHLEGDVSHSRLALRGDVNLPAAGTERFAVEVAGTVVSPVVTPI